METDRVGKLELPEMKVILRTPSRIAGPHFEIVSKQVVPHPMNDLHEPQQPGSRPQQSDDPRPGAPASHGPAAEHVEGLDEQPRPGASTLPPGM